jgi:hypothetical protein
MGGQQKHVAHPTRLHSQICVSNKNVILPKPPNNSGYHLLEKQYRQ